MKALYWKDLPFNFFLGEFAISDAARNATHTFFVYFFLTLIKILIWNLT